MVTGYPPSVSESAFATKCCGQLNTVISHKSCGIPKFPLSCWGLTGAVIASKLVICGGKCDISGTTVTSDECNVLGAQDDAWTFTGKMLEKRRQAASIEFDGKMLITGGTNSADEAGLITTELFDFTKAQLIIWPLFSA